MAKRLLIIGLLIILLGGVAYNAYLILNSEEESKNIKAKEERIQELQAKVSALESQVKSGGSTQVQKPSGNGGGSDFKCADCHTNVENFHTVKMVTAIDKKKNRTPRTCPTCHGSKVHTIHQDALSSNRMECQNCHMTKSGEFIIPEKREGDTFVCEVCHFDGNYITIHKGKCERCHPVNIADIHSSVLKNREEEIKEMAENLS